MASDFLLWDGWVELVVLPFVWSSLKNLLLSSAIYMMEGSDLFCGRLLGSGENNARFPWIRRENRATPMRAAAAHNRLSHCKPRS